MLGQWDRVFRYRDCTGRVTKTVVNVESAVKGVDRRLKIGIRQCGDLCSPDPKQ